jgi:hypothetical protein
MTLWRAAWATFDPVSATVLLFISGTSQVEGGVSRTKPYALSMRESRIERGLVYPCVSSANRVTAIYSSSLIEVA